MWPHRCIIKQSGPEALDHSICEVISLCSACSSQVVSQFVSSGFSGLVTHMRGSCVSVSLGFARPCCMQDNGLLSCRSAGPSAPGHNPPTSQHASSDGAPHLRSHACAASSACAEYGSATSYHMQQAVVPSTSLRPGSVLWRHRSHDWWVGVSCERFGGAGPSCMQDQGLISPRSNRRRPRGTTSRASRHLSSDFV